MSIPPEVLKKIKLLEVGTRKLVHTSFAGSYRSRFKGQGMTFSDFREYVPGDDVRSIAWPLTARTGQTYIKQFVEERQLTLILAVDVSGSLLFGSGQGFKGETLGHLSALLGFSAAQNKDNVGLLLFTDQVEHFVPPKRGRGHIQRILRDLYYYKVQSQGTRLNIVGEYLTGILKKRSTVFIFSDFIDLDGFSSSLKRLGKRHEVVAVRIEDPIESKGLPIGLVDFEDPETGRTLTLDTESPSFKKSYKELYRKFREKVDQELQQSQVPVVEVQNSADFVEPLARFLKQGKLR